MEPQFRTRNRSANLLEDKNQVKSGFGKRKQDDDTDSRRKRNTRTLATWIHRVTSWEVVCALCMSCWCCALFCVVTGKYTDNSDFVCVCRHPVVRLVTMSSNVLDTLMRFERMMWTRKWMSRLWSFTVFSRRLWWQIPVCLRCCVCIWSLHLQVEIVVDITGNVMETRRRTQYHPCLQIPWDLIVIALPDCVVEHVFVRFERYFHPSETRVNRVTTRVWFQDTFRVLSWLQRSWTHQVFLFCTIQNLQIYSVSHEKGDSNHVCRLFWMGENWVCDGGEYTKLTWPNFTVKSTQSWPGQKYHPCLQIPWDLVIITLDDCVSFTHVGLWNMYLSGLRDTSIPVKQGWTELSPECGFKIPSEF